MLFDSSEQPCEIVTKLKNIEAVEGDEIYLELVLSKPRKVTWNRDTHPVPLDSERCIASFDESGLCCSLRISSISVEDSGTYTASVEDNQYGTIISSSTVSVKGAITHALSLLFHQCPTCANLLCPIL